MTNWRLFAACKDTDPEELDFFSSDQDERYRARAVCQAECPVRLDCLQHALSTPELHGVWGGVDEYEIRRALSVDKNGDPSRRARPPRCPGCMNRNYSIVKKMRNQTHVECEKCGLTWTIKRPPRAKQVEQTA